jgi:hypothetical protein
MRMSLVQLGVVGVVLLASMACGDSPTMPDGGLTGTWKGSYTRGSLNGVIMLELTQSGLALAGTWSASGMGTGLTERGTLGGTVTGATVGIALTPTAPIVCAPTVTLSGTLAVTGVVDGNRLTGDYVVFLCEGIGSGRIDVVRQ